MGENKATAVVNLSENAKRVLSARYLIKRSDGMETPEELFNRVATEVASAEITPEDKTVWKETFYNLMASGKFMPNSPTLMNAGRKLGMLSACFVLPVEDDIHGIFKSIADTAVIQKAGGGTGFAFDSLRPCGITVSSSGGRASGPVSFWRVFSEATSSIQQGSFRRGANMAVMRLDHPDIIKFLFAKQDLNQFTNYNISVKVTDSQMLLLSTTNKFVVNWGDTKWLVPKSLVDKCKAAVAAGANGTGCARDLDTCYDVNDLVPISNNPSVPVLSYKDVYDIIVHNAWQTGEPGLLFIDRIRATEATPAIGLIQSTNPCVAGETLVSTEDGYVQIKDIVDKPTVVAINGELFETAGSFKTGTKMTYRVITKEGFTVRATGNHKFFLVDGSSKALDDLVAGDILLIDNIKSNAEFIEKTDPAEEDVFNITVPGPHKFVANGFVVSNCGEQPLLPYEACNLGSIDISKFIVTSTIGKPPDTSSELNTPALVSAVQSCIRFLDNVITVNKYPIPEIKDMCHANRKIGLGIMGFADALIKLGIRYDSEQAIKFANDTMAIITKAAGEASESLAKTRGAFPNCDNSVYAKNPRRNACVTCIAPTGSISIIANCSGGIEPWFSFVFTRHILNGQTMMECHPDFLKAIEDNKLDKDSVTEYMYAMGTLAGYTKEKIPDKMLELFRTARDVTPSWHVRLQSTFQKHVTAAVSKTINLPFEADEEMVAETYETAWKLNCKGVTVYRDGSRYTQPMALKAPTAVEKPADKPVEKIGEFRTPRKLTYPAPSTRTLYKSTHGSLHIHVTYQREADGRWREYEVFFDVGRSGDSIHPIINVYARLISIILRLGGSLYTVIDQLYGHVAKYEKPNGATGSLTSLPAELALGLLDYFNSVAQYRDDSGMLIQLPFHCDQSPVAVPKDLANKAKQFVERVMKASAVAGTLRVPCRFSTCNGEVIYTEGCARCTVCGDSKCQ